MTTREHLIRSLGLPPTVSDVDLLAAARARVEEEFQIATRLTHFHVESAMINVDNLIQDGGR